MCCNFDCSDDGSQRFFCFSSATMRKTVNDFNKPVAVLVKSFY